MHVKKILHKLLSSVMHQKRLMTLIILVDALLISKKLSLSQLARGTNLSIQERSAIKRTDRFLGNKQIEKEAIYTEMNKMIIGSQQRPVLIVDWSEIPNSTLHVLRAALISSGRALTVFETVHREKKLYHASVEKYFLTRLKKVLPEGCCPIVVTDAGFHNAWFKRVLAMGWDYVGRVRSNKSYSSNEGATWHSYKTLLEQATGKPTCYGDVILCRKTALKTSIYVVKERVKGRQALNCYGKKRQNALSLKYRQAARDPWVLASSLSGNEMANKVVSLYKKRMQIEAGFRDLKSSRYGFSFEHAYSKQPHRISILLLISTLAAVIAGLTGRVVEKLNMHCQFQVNSITTRRVLSLFYLGCRVIAKRIKVPLHMLWTAAQEEFAYV